MVRRTSLAIIAAMALVASAGAEQASPRFSFADEVIITRNDALTQLLPIDPRGVRKILDAIEAAKREPPKDIPPRHRDITPNESGKDDVPRLDPFKNPDLNIVFQRASPEAAYDLFQILKQVGRQTN